MRFALRPLRGNRWWLALAAALCLLGRDGRADIATLKNGMSVDGNWLPIGSMQADPTKGVGGNVPLKQIVVLNNQLTRTFFGTSQLAKEFAPSAAMRAETIKVPQRVATTGLKIGSVGSPLRREPFDAWGRRTMTMRTERGSLDIVQGITEITPTWTKVEAIQGTNSYIWDMRIATSSIPREQLSRVLYKVIDSKNSEQRLRVVRLYLQAERFQDARKELELLLQDFPDLAHLKDQVKALHQLNAQRLIKEVELRREAGQEQLANLMLTGMLEQFPVDGVAGETLLKARELLDASRTDRLQMENILKLLKQQLAAIPDEAARVSCQPQVEEIARELNSTTLPRFADFLRLADDPKITANGKVSLAISGWLLGSGSAVENLPVAQSLVKVRALVQQYLTTVRQPERDVLLEQLTSLEGATPEYLAKIIAHMRPPLERETFMVPAAAAEPQVTEAKSGTEGTPQAAEPNAAQPASDAIPGFFELTVKGLAEDPDIKYWVQLPAEYDSYRRYPCIVTLDGGGTTPLDQINWWAGDYSPEARTRYGQATRHSYIVIAPEWTREHQRRYEFSAREHAAVLLPLRDACKRFSIDTDRVFLSGHSMGGDAAWDLGLSHPDLWAGVVPIVATADKYVNIYAENGRYLPMYFVSGEMDDGNRRAKNAPNWDDYLTKRGYDTMVVEYLGRGHEDFHDEIQNLFAWMNLHRREFHLKEFTVKSLRPWDNFFWWLETDRPLAANMVLPAAWGAVPRPAITTAKVNAANGIQVTSACKGVTVWLSPELITFDASLKVTINGKAIKNIQPSAATLLEDVRTRGDRQHPFWAKAGN